MGLKVYGTWVVLNFYLLSYFPKLAGLPRATVVMVVPSQFGFFLCFCLCKLNLEKICDFMLMSFG